MNRFNFLLSLGLFALLQPVWLQAQDPGLTYQGQLRQSGDSFSGTADLEFRLFSQLNGGNQVGGTVSLPDWPVDNGLFQVDLDFGQNAFDGSERYLEVRVNGASLTPRQKVTATPYALLAVAVPPDSIGLTEINASEVQRRVEDACPAGEFVREVNQDGSVTCGVDSDTGGTVTEITTGSGLQGGPITDSGTISIAPGGVGASQINSGQVQQRVSGTCPAGQSIRVVNQNGTVVCEVDAVGEAGWSLGGNAGTNPATDFLGTTDAIPFEIRTDAARSLRIEPSSDLSQGLPITSNIIAGSRANSVVSGVRGATIAGGGLPEDSTPDFVNEAPNRVTFDFGTIGGGWANEAGNSATVGGGRLNAATDFATVVAGGDQNVASKTRSAVGGGGNNAASGIGSVVSGGEGNAASNLQSTVGGGGANIANGSRATVAGGLQNEAIGSGSFAGGGSGNAARGVLSTISGGFDNEASGDQSVVAGGQVNSADGNWSAVSGGQSNCAGGDHSWASGNRAKVRASGDGTGCGFSTPGSGDADGDEGTFIWADSQSQDFVSNGPNQFLVRAQGGVGFGGTPTDYFDIRTPVVFTPGDGVPEDGAFRVRLDGATKFRVFANGGVGVGSSFSGPGVPENGLRVQGRVQLESLGFGGNTDLCRNADDEVAICSSSSRYKDDVGMLDLGLDAVLALAPVSYRWTSDDSRDIGFVAEDVAEIDERLITRNPDGEIEGVRYNRLTAVLANAVQDMAREQQQQSSGIEAISAENERLRERLAQLESDGAETQRTLAAENEQLRARLAALEAQHATELESLSLQLALLRDVVMPRTVQSEVEGQGRSSVRESLQ